LPTSVSEDNNSVDKGWVFAECEQAGPGEAKKEAGLIEDLYDAPGSRRRPCNGTGQKNSGRGKRETQRQHRGGDVAGGSPDEFLN
jgi:hypothetical protein